MLIRELVLLVETILLSRLSYLVVVYFTFKISNTLINIPNKTLLSYTKVAKAYLLYSN